MAGTDLHQEKNHLVACNENNPKRTIIFVGKLLSDLLDNLQVGEKRDSVGGGGGRGGCYSGLSRRRRRQDVLSAHKLKNVENSPSLLLQSQRLQKIYGEGMG